jgi:hypothetical protein
MSDNAPESKILAGAGTYSLKQEDTPTDEVEDTSALAEASDPYVDEDEAVRMIQAWLREHQDE